ncbi:hypothetical protein [Porphyrobacter sp. YT40]|uniref:hypothetical protein n=1 Tax=Porphyrobacter sp. YT40 TaxID=2547601 RepID=UPI001142F7A9|nr:hypothetical protein [Porphyrobacter sp. YT40]QDH35835.1 hypothetical protein E2E27_16840 [Porphyrobacter sp. YT40]
MTLDLTFREFLVGWLPTVAAVAVTPPPSPALGHMFLVDLGGVPVPVVTCLFAVLGIGLSRLLARRTEAKLGWPSFIAVTVIMLVVALLWIIESRPSWLYAFVVSIGLGFSGYSLIELFGEQVRSFVTDIFDKARSTIGRKGDDT